MNRRERFFRAWYQDQQQYSMGAEEWLYIARLTLICAVGFGFGLTVGLVVVAFL